MRKQHSYYVYITTNPKQTILYIGVTNNLGRRLVEHYANKGDNRTFAGRYYAYNLIYCEHFQYINSAIAREKELKKWNRKQKEELIATKNPKWIFYNDKFCGEWPPHKAWGKYLEKFKQQKKIKNKLTNEESTVCIYQEEVETILIEDKIKAKEESTTISNNVLSKLVAIEHQIVESHKLSKRENFLIKIALLIVLDHPEELSILLKEVPKDIVTQEDIEEVFVQVSFYAGFPIIKTMLEKVELFFDNQDDA